MLNGFDAIHNFLQTAQPFNQKRKDSKSLNELILSVKSDSQSHHSIEQTILNQNSGDGRFSLMG